jgi:hypothetical protein
MIQAFGSNAANNYGNRRAAGRFLSRRAFRRRPEKQQAPARRLQPTALDALTHSIEAVRLTEAGIVEVRRSNWANAIAAG